MRPIDLWRHEVRRAGWTALLTPPVATAALVLIALLDGGADTDRNLVAALEMALPLAVGIGAASLVGRDPAVELQIAGPVPGALFNFLRPEATAATAWLSIGVLLALATLVLTAAPALRARTTR